MAQFIFRERIFDVGCLMAGAVGRAFGFSMRRPIFIVGTGRCGTTLLVDLLKSNPQLVGFPGEANEVWHPALEPFDTAQVDIPPIEVDPRRFTKISVANWPSNYRNRIRDIFTGFHLLAGPSKIFFTKSAMISFLIPEILEIFPDARFIHIYRYGPSVVESYFKKNFGKYLKYKFSESEYRNHCANYWNTCILEITETSERMSLVEKGQFLEFSYEELCMYPLRILADLASFLGVDVGRFGYDVSKISSQNYKARDYRTTPENALLFDVMSSGMRLKGYLPGDVL